MEEKCLLIGGNGVGDCLLSLQCSIFVNQPTIYLATRDEVYKPLKYLFQDKFNLTQIEEKYGENNAILKSDEMWQTITADFDCAYYIIPDLLFNNKYAFDFKRFGLTPDIIAKIRLLSYNGLPKKKLIYLGLISTTEGYTYYAQEALAIRLSKTFPDYEIYFPILDKWANKNIAPINLPSNLPSNLTVDRNPDFIKSIEKLRTSCYFIGTDNGPSHLAYHLGIPRILLDPQYGRLPWIARWREDVTESIPLNTDVGNIINIVRANFEIPATYLIPRMNCMWSHNWKNDLLLKYE